MNKPIIVVAVIVVILVLAVIFGTYLGFIPDNFGLLPTDGDGETPPGTTYCDYTDLQILGMLELISGKSLNNQQGLAFVDALNMKACGQDDKTYLDIVTYYKTEYVEWDLIGEQSYSGAGWSADTIVWGNDPTVPTSAKSIMTGGGISIKEYYGYNTMTITGSGTWVTYQAFALWLLSS